MIGPDTQMRMLSASELTQVGGGGFVGATSALATTAVAAKAADYDEGNWCGNGFRVGPGPHWGVVAVGAVLVT